MRVSVREREYKIKNELKNYMLNGLFMCICVCVNVVGILFSWYCLVYLTSVAVHLHAAVHLALVVVAVVPSNYMLKHPKLLN